MGGGSCGSRTANGEQQENPCLRGAQSWASPPASHSFKNVFSNLVILISLDTVQEYCEWRTNPGAVALISP